MICAASNCRAQATHRLRIRFANGRRYDDLVCKACGDRLRERFRDCPKPETLSDSLVAIPATTKREAA